MKGTLIKNGKECEIRYNNDTLSLPLHPDDVEYLESMLPSDHTIEIKYVRFKIVDVPSEPAGTNIWTNRWAKIIWDETL